MNEQLTTIVKDINDLKNLYESFYANKLSPILHNIYETLGSDIQKLGISSGCENSVDQHTYFTERLIHASYTGRKIKDKFKLGSDRLHKLGYGYRFDKELLKQFPVYSEHINVSAKELEFEEHQFTGKRYAQSEVVIKNIPQFDHGGMLGSVIMGLSSGPIDLYEDNKIGLRLTKEVYRISEGNGYDNIYRQGDHVRPNGRAGLEGVISKLIENYIFHNKKQLIIGTYMTVVGQFKKNYTQEFRTLPQKHINEKLSGVLQLHLNEKDQLIYELTL